MKLKYAELHTPLFLAGSNLATKLDPKKRGGMRLDYDRKEKELSVSYNGHIAIIPAGNIASMEEAQEADLKPIVIEPIKTGKPVKAQVSVPAGLKND